MNSYMRQTKARRREGGIFRISVRVIAEVRREMVGGGVFVRPVGSGLFEALWHGPVGLRTIRRCDGNTVSWSGRLKKRTKSEIPPCVTEPRPVIVGRAVTNRVLGPRPSGHFSSLSLPRSHPYRSSCRSVQRPSGSEEAPLPPGSTVDTLCAPLGSRRHSGPVRSTEDRRSRDSLPLSDLG